MSTLQGRVRLQRKAEDLATLKRVGDLTGQITVQLTELSEQMNNLTEESISMSTISENWQTILRSISIASSTLHEYKRADYDNGAVLPEPLLRLKLNPDTKKVMSTEEAEQGLEGEDVDQEVLEYQSVLGEQEE